MKKNKNLFTENEHELQNSVLLDNSDAYTRCINESDISQINATQTADLNNLVFCK